MKTLITIFVLAVAAAVGLAASASAQQVAHRVEQPTPLEADNPLAVRSAALVKHILAGEKAAAVALMRKEADEGYVKGGTLETDVEKQIVRLSAEKYKIQEFHQGRGTDVVVILANARGEETGIVIRYNADKKMTGFAEARIAR